MRNKALYILSVLILGSFSINAQEALTNLVVNPNIKKSKISQSRTKSLMAKSLTELPFIDDFSKSTGHPDSSLWIDKYAFINLTYPYDPPSIGVATLDAIDETGSIYLDTVLNSFGADTLTSKLINLNYPGDNTIFLSFYYQPGGLGDTPDLKDSLILEYYSRDSVEWNKIWHVVFNEKDSVLKEYYKYNDNTKTILGDTIVDLKHTFQQVIVPVNEDQYLKDTFQFRFRNVASLSVITDFQSTASNSDHWNIDYVILNKGRTINDTIVGDVAFSKPIGSLLKTYNALPWTHFTRAIAYEMEEFIEITYRNLTDTAQNPEKFYEIEDLLGETGATLLLGGVIDDVKPDSTQTYLRPIDYIFPYNTSNDSALFEVRSYLETNLTPLLWNDTTRFYQKFYNYYAYDDGTAENGYGIIGESTENAMVAMRYNTYKKDTLRGVQVFFNQTFNNSNQYSFKIHVWSDNDGKPGDILFTQEGLKPENTDELNKFTLIAFDDILVLDGSFFIGWQKKNTPQMLNVGFDANSINNNKLYYNYSGNWVQSQFNGTIMIRPMFGHEINLTTNIDSKPESKSFDYSIYPNPAQNYLNINIPDQDYTNYRYTIFDTYGRVFIDKASSESTIDISKLNPGIYFLRISNTGKTSATKKFLIIR